MNKATFRLGNLEFSFTDADVCNLDEWIPEDESNPNKIRPWLFHDHGFTLAVVFAATLQDALDIAADEDKLDRYKLIVAELAEIEDDERVSYLGNHGEPYDIEGLDYIALPNIRASFAVQFETEVNKPSQTICGHRGCAREPGHFPGHTDR